MYDIEHTIIDKHVLFTLFRKHALFNKNVFKSNMSRHLSLPYNAGMCSPPRERRPVSNVVMCILPWRVKSYVEPGIWIWQPAWSLVLWSLSERDLQISRLELVWLNVQIQVCLKTIQRHWHGPVLNNRQLLTCTFCSFCSALTEHVGVDESNLVNDNILL